ncbi:VTT domain-containing protein [Salipiger sp. P9]|uniref:DedA family protein n=1 Tax=Salipiger pentaromativorans TaxID=2943193 RepID=UPI0021578F6D|nr:VTT domain-containing protein [Salipiger pentaromativorans]MCR8547836.1 VTT domain-containing protein [Salipiger pentaromativorans]
MLGLETVAALIAKDGLAILAPIAVLEGPIVTVIAAWLASRGLLDVWSVSVVVILADVVGDLMFYALGRWGLHRLPLRWRYRMGLSRARLAQLAGHFQSHGGRTLVFGKLTHSAGAAVLVAAGLARMPMLRFFWINLLATIPKSLFFVALGYAFGSAYSKIDDWIARISLLLLGVLVMAGIIWLLKRATRK